MDEQRQDELTTGRFEVETGFGTNRGRPFVEVRFDAPDGHPVRVQLPPADVVEAEEFGPDAGEAP